MDPHHDRQPSTAAARVRCPHVEVQAVLTWARRLLSRPAITGEIAGCGAAAPGTSASGLRPTAAAAVEPAAGAAGRTAVPRRGIPGTPPPHPFHCPRTQLPRWERCTCMMPRKGGDLPDHPSPTPSDGGQLNFRTAALRPRTVARGSRRPGGVPRASGAVRRPTALGGVVQRSAASTTSPRSTNLEAGRRAAMPPSPSETSGV